MALFFVLIKQAPAKKTIPPKVPESVSVEKVINLFYGFYALQVWVSRELTLVRPSCPANV